MNSKIKKLEIKCCKDILLKERLPKLDLENPNDMEITFKFWDKINSSEKETMYKAVHEL